MAKKSTLVLSVEQILAQSDHAHAAAYEAEARPIYGDRETYGVVRLTRRLIAVAAGRPVRPDEADALHAADARLSEAQRLLEIRIDEHEAIDRDELEPAAEQAIAALRLTATQLQQPDQLDGRLKRGISEVATIAADHLEERLA